MGTLKIPKLLLLTTFANNPASSDCPKYRILSKVNQFYIKS